MRISLFSFVLSFGVCAFAGPNHEMPPVKVSPQFESMKALIGTWEGKTKMSGKEEIITTTFELTSGGTAIVEKTMPGTPHEMVTVYANRGDDVHVTHYCMLGNQPQMKLKKAKDMKFAFEMDGANGISDQNEPHMHSVTLAVKGKKLKQEWTNFKDNKKGEVVVFNLTKKE